MFELDLCERWVPKIKGSEISKGKCSTCTYNKGSFCVGPSTPLRQIVGGKESV